MSKATKNFIAGALVATLPLFVASLMKDDAQVVQSDGTAVVMDHNRAKAAELGLAYAPNLLPPARAIEYELKSVGPQPENIRLDSSKAVVGGRLQTSEVFTTDLVWNQKPLLGTFIYSNQCEFADGEYVGARITVQHTSTPSWKVAQPDVDISAANSVDSTALAADNFCIRMETGGVFDELRGMAAGGNTTASALAD